MPNSFKSDLLSLFALGNPNNNFLLHDEEYVRNQDIKEGKPYTFDYSTLISNHPLFLMSEHDRYKLMSHPLSRSLVYKKFFTFGINLFVASILLHLTYLGVYTTIMLRTKHPQIYYNSTGITFTHELCRNVTQALGSDSLKEPLDVALQFTMYALIAMGFAKNIIQIVLHAKTKPTKTFTFVFEVTSIGLGLYFAFDFEHQYRFVMRCPLQWECGAFGLFVGYIALFYYIQYSPIIGIYVLMLRKITIRFLLFVPVMMVLISAFALSFYMIFQNSDTFGSIPFSLAKISRYMLFVLFSQPLKL